MIIDLILDRKDGYAYDPKEFYDEVTEYASDFDANYMRDIARALDSGTNKDIQKALCKYIDIESYNPKIKDYINSVNWLEDSKGNFYDSYSYDKWYRKNKWHL